MPETAENIIFGSDLELGGFTKGIDSLIAQLKRAEEAGNSFNETFTKIEGSVQSLQQTTGKSIAPSLNDGKLNQQMDTIKTGMAEMQATVQKSTDNASNALRQLITVQEKYRNEIKNLNVALKQNEKEFNDVARQLQNLRASGKGASDAAKDLRAQLSTIRSGNVELKNSIVTAKTEMAAHTTAMRTQITALKQAETAGNGFSKGLTTMYGGLRKLAYLIPGLGIAGLMSLIAGPLISAFTEWFNKTTEAEESMKRLKDTIAGAGSAFQKATTDVFSLKNEIQLAKDGFLDKDVVLKHYNETIGKTTGFVKSLDEAEKELVKNGQAYIQMTLYKAAANFALESAAKVAFEKVQESRKTDKESSTFLDNITSLFGQKNEIGSQAAADEFQKKLAEEGKKNKDKIIKQKQKEQDDLVSIADAFQKAAAQIAKGFNFNFNPVPTPKPDKKPILNIYEKELNSLLKGITDINRKTFTNQDTIQTALDAEFAIKRKQYLDAFKKKQLSAKELDDLNTKLNQLYQLTLQKNLKDFNDKRAQYLEGVSASLEQLQSELSLKRIAGIKDVFEKERQSIIFEQSKSLTAINDRRKKQIADLEKNAGTYGISGAELQKQIENVNNASNELISQVYTNTAEKTQELSFKIFQKLSKDLEQSFDKSKDNLSALSLIDIQKQTELYTLGKISYKQYQEALTKIAEDETNARLQNEVDKLRKLIRIRESEVMTGKGLSDEDKEKLLAEIQSLQKQLNEALKQLGKPPKTDGNPDSPLGRLATYANAVKNITDSVIGFWQSVNEAESRSLDRSIALQDRRVEAARNVANKGNAEYLRLEEEKQQQLLIRQENAARRQLAINAALQASQLTVALISGIAQGATTGGALGSIIQVGAIVAAIAGAFAIAQSLRPPQPSFFVGTEDTGKGGNVDNKGGFHAVLHPEERVMTAEQNKHLKGITNDELVSIARNHRVLVNDWNMPKTPRLNIAAMDLSNDMKVGADARLAGILEDNNRKLDENNILQKGIIRALKGMGVSVNMDRKGIAVSVMETVDEIEKSKRK